MLDDATVLDYALNLKEWYMGDDLLYMRVTDCTVQCHKIMAGTLLRPLHVVSLKTRVHEKNYPSSSSLSCFANSNTGWLNDIFYAQFITMHLLIISKVLVLFNAYVLAMERVSWVIYT